MKRGVSLLEIVISLALLALGIVFVLGIIPTGVLSVKRAEDIQTATAYAADLLEEARRQVPPAGIQDIEIELNHTTFKIQREVVAVAAGLTDVVVTVNWDASPSGLRVATRLRGKPP